MALGTSELRREMAIQRICALRALRTHTANVERTLEKSIDLLSAQNNDPRETV